MAGVLFCNILSPHPTQAPERPPQGLSVVLPLGHSSHPPAHPGLLAQQGFLPGFSLAAVSGQQGRWAGQTAA